LLKADRLMTQCHCACVTTHAPGSNLSIHGAVLSVPVVPLFRGNAREGTPVAQALNDLGYQNSVVNYRLRPFTVQEAALDLRRAVRYVRHHAKEYGIEEEHNGVIGFSAGGILFGTHIRDLDGDSRGYEGADHEIHSPGRVHVFCTPFLDSLRPKRR
jgi:hypothetical protein